MEIVVRAVVIYFFLWLVTRAVGRSTLGELNTFQLLLYITMGDLVPQAITQQDYSVTAGMLAVGTFAVLTVTIGLVSYKWPRARPLITGRAVVIVRDGEPVGETMKTERLSLDDLMEAAREQGIRRFDDIDLAVLEVDGKISFFKKNDSGSDGAPDQSQAA